MLRVELNFYPSLQPYLAVRPGLAERTGLVRNGPRRGRAKKSSSRLPRCSRSRTARASSVGRGLGGRGGGLPSYKSWNALPDALEEVPADIEGAMGCEQERSTDLTATIMQGEDMVQKMVDEANAECTGGT